MSCGFVTQIDMLNLTYFTESYSGEEDDASQSASQYWIEELVLPESSSGSDVKELGDNDSTSRHNFYLLMCS
jgi:hypothetical protein